MSHTIKIWGPDGKQADAPAVFVVMRTIRRPQGTQTSPIAVCATPESAARMCSDFVVTWSNDLSVLHEDCPAWYFVPVESKP